jgi:hypothetical protein
MERGPDNRAFIAGLTSSRSTALDAVHVPRARISSKSETDMTESPPKANRSVRQIRRGKRLFRSQKRLIGSQRRLHPLSGLLHQLDEPNRKPDREDAFRGWLMVGDLHADLRTPCITEGVEICRGPWVEGDVG